ncbi:glycoside hydrolase superfamily [Phycomyces nitens]|nr:glycoside hydrolase superfamily [Phycomyces nitens]
MLFYPLALLSLAFAAVQARTTGVDVSALTSTSSFSCVKNLGYDYAIIRCYIEAWGNSPGGKVDSNCYQNYLNAKAAGISKIDIYMFPCTGRSTCKSAATQVNELVSYVGANKMIVGRLWFDVEIDSSANNWPSTSSARTTLAAFHSAWSATGWKWGIYSSYYQWQTITGSASYVLDSSLPLWYPHYDDSLSFGDFSSFGGWTTPTLKQYSGDQTFCSAGFDKNYAP